MNFHEFKNIIRNIRETIPCPTCHKKLEENTIHMIGTVFNESFFLSHCHDCKHDMMIHVTFRGKERTHRSLRTNSTMKLVNQDDILDMHNFLKEFNGDFVSLFSKK